MHNKSMRRKQILRAKRLLDESGELTRQQVDMAIMVISTMPGNVMDSYIEELEKNPKGILNDIRMPVRRVRAREA